MLKIRLCTRDNLCVDCDNEKCIGAGQIESDCPKWICTEAGDCENCTFIKDYITSRKKWEGYKCSKC